MTAAVDYLKAERGAQDVAVLCLSVRCLSVMAAVASSPGSYDQFVLVSPAFGDVALLGDAPKLFISSPDDPAAEFTEPLIEAALGQDNVVLEVAPAGISSTYRSDRRRPGRVWGEGAAGSIEDLIADAPGDDIEVLEVAGSAHAQAIFETSAGAEVMEAILRRLSS